MDGGHLGERNRPVQEARPGFDAELLADILLNSLHTDLARHLPASGDTQHPVSTLAHLATALLY